MRRNVADGPVKSPSSRTIGEASTLIHDANHDVRYDRAKYADAFRALAIFSVVICHVIGVLPHASAGFAAQLENIGGWGVGFFFVLSGFLLGRPYIDAILDPATRTFPSSRKFFTRRFYRIVPLYAFAVLVTAGAGLLSHHSRVSLTNVALHLTFLHGFFPKYDDAPFGPLWTMAVDAQFYLALPAAAFVAYVVLRGRSPRVRLWGIIAIVLATIAASVVWRYVIVSAAPVVITDFPTSLVYVRNVFGMGSSFALGIALALACGSSDRPSQRWCALALAAGAALALAFFAVSMYGSVATSLIYGDLLAALSAALLLWGSIEGRFGALSRIARSPITSTIAALSYAVYLFHKPIIVGVRDVLSARGRLTSSFDVIAMIVISAVLLSVMAVAGHHLIERPFLRARDRNREAPQSAPSTASEAEKSVPIQSFDSAPVVDDETRKVTMRR